MPNRKTAEVFTKTREGEAMKLADGQKGWLQKYGGVWHRWTGYVSASSGKFRPFCGAWIYGPTVIYPPDEPDGRLCRLCEKVAKVKSWTPEETTRDERDPGSICPHCSGDISEVVTAAATKLLLRAAQRPSRDWRKGFASMTPERRREAAQRGGQSSKRRRLKDEEIVLSGGNEK